MASQDHENPENVMDFENVLTRPRLCFLENDEIFQKFWKSDTFLIIKSNCDRRRKISQDIFMFWKLALTSS